MKLHLTQSAGQHLITGHGHDWVEVNEARYTDSLIVLPGRLITEWHPGRFEDLDEASLEPLLALQPEVVLLGTGPTHCFAHPRLYSALTGAGIGVECMSTAAACRTYNILMAEGRHVAAALIIQPP